MLKDITSYLNDENVYAFRNLSGWKSSQNTAHKFYCVRFIYLNHIIIKPFMILHLSLDFKLPIQNFVLTIQTITLCESDLWQIICPIWYFHLYSHWWKNYWKPSFALSLWSSVSIISSCTIASLILLSLFVII